MKPSSIHLYIAALLLIGSTTVLGQQCNGLKDVQAQTSNSSALQSLINAIFSDPVQAECGSLTNVLDSVVNTKKIGGRKLEEDKPYDPAAAQANLAKAQADPEVRQRLDKIRKEVPDGPKRLVYEAAALDEEGYYGARDLRVHQLQQQLK